MGSRCRFDKKADFVEFRLSSEQQVLQKLKGHHPVGLLSGKTIVDLSLYDTNQAPCGDSGTTCECDEDAAWKVAVLLCVGEQFRRLLRLLNE